MLAAKHYACAVLVRLNKLLFDLHLMVRDFLAFQQQGELACAWRDAATVVLILFFLKKKNLKVILSNTATKLHIIQTWYQQYTQKINI